ncbi:MAG: DUF5694 domain-containing protein [Aquaticitalea sp.]
MMKKIFCLLLLISISSSLIAQTVSKKINVILLGTFHYGATSDGHKTNFPDLFSEKRQHELELLTDTLVALKIDKIFIEREEQFQSKYDSLYQNYLIDQLKDTLVIRPEEIQIGFRLAKKSQLEKVYCVDVQQELPYDKLNEFEEKFKGKLDAPFFSANEYPFTDPSEKLDLPHQNLSDYYAKLNNVYHQQARLYDYLHYAMSYVETNDYTGPEFSAVWYARNLKIFSQILKYLASEDQTILVLFGSSHTDVLKTFFESHPLFHIVDLETILK